MLTALWGYLIHLLLDNVFDNVKLFTAIHSSIHPLFNTPSQDVAQLVLPRYVAQRDPNTWRRLIMHPRLVTQEHPENPPTHRTSPSEMWYFD